jgi:hypothetical protein
MLIGPLVKASGSSPKAFEPDPKLEAALEHFLQESFRHNRGR